MQTIHDLFAEVQDQIEESYGEAGDDYMNALYDAQDAVTIWDAAGMDGAAEAAMRLRNKASQIDDPYISGIFREFAANLAS